MFNQQGAEHTVTQNFGKVSADRTMPNSEKLPLVHFDKNGLFSQEPSSCIKHHYMHG